jgi:hypothetical protein
MTLLLLGALFLIGPVADVAGRLTQEMIRPG